MSGSAADRAGRGSGARVARLDLKDSLGHPCRGRRTDFSTEPAQERLCDVLRGNGSALAQQVLRFRLVLVLRATALMDKAEGIYLGEESGCFL